MCFHHIKHGKSCSLCDRPQACSQREDINTLQCGLFAQVNGGFNRLSHVVKSCHLVGDVFNDPSSCGNGAEILLILLEAR